MEHRRSDVFQPHDEHPRWQEGYRDGLEGRKQLPPFDSETDYHEYMEGYWIGQDVALGDTDQLTKEERKEVYGDDRG